jgi:hypothetical protein
MARILEGPASTILPPLWRLAKAKVMEFNLQQSTDYILDKGNSSQSRAIELFTFLVVLHRGKSLTAISGRDGSSANRVSSLVFSVSAKTVRAARAVAGMKFLDAIEQDWKKKLGKDAVPLIRKMIEIPEYEEIVNRFITENGSWYRLRFIDSVRDLESDLKDRKTHARNVARIIEFSFRFVPNLKKPKQLGGVTMATDIVTSVRCFKVKGGDSQLEKAWSRLKSAAPFFYLIYVQKYPFYLRKIVGSRFTNRFLAMISDYERLVEFFAQYNFLIERLRSRGYQYSPLRLPNDIKYRPILSEPFNKKAAGEQAVLDAIESYRK